MLAGLTVALIIVILALLVAAIGAIGIAAIGWLLSRWFDLSQWQGSLIALAASLSVGFAVYRLATVGDSNSEPEWIEWGEEDEVDEPPVVPWRRRRPKQGNLPDRPDGPKQRGSNRK